MQTSTKRRQRVRDVEREQNAERAARITRAFQAARLEQDRRNAATGRCCTKCLRGTRALDYGCARYGDCACHRKRAA